MDAKGRTKYGSMDGVRPIAYDGAQTRCTQEDFRSLAFAGRLMVSCKGKIGDILEPRLRAAGVWQRWRAGVAMMGRALDGAYRTIPNDQFERLYVLFTQGQIDIHLKLASERHEGAVPVNANALETLARAAMEGTCAICLESGARAERCSLARALDGCLETETREARTGCRWRDQLLRDREAAKEG